MKSLIKLIRIRERDRENKLYGNIDDNVSDAAALKSSWSEIWRKFSQDSKIFDVEIRYLLK